MSQLKMKLFEDKKDDSPGDKKKTTEPEVDEKEGIRALLQELIEDEYKYDIRFWPDNRITLKAIKEIAEEKEEIMCHRIEYVIRVVIKNGGTAEQIYEIMNSNYKRNIKKLIKHWWGGLNTFYKNTLSKEIEARNIEGILTWGKHSRDAYMEYKMFCKYVNEISQPEPKYIEEARIIYRDIKNTSKPE